MENNLRPKISIIIPAYNVAAYIRKGLESCLRQSWPNLEVIVTDDGSSDDTWNIIQEYARQDPRIFPLHQDNSGVAAARNFALDHAGGDYLLFLDSDDWLETNAVQILVEQLTDEKQLLCSDRYDVTIDEKAGSYLCISQVGNYAEETCDNLLAFHYVGLQSKFRLASSCYKLFCRKIIEQHHLRFTNGIHQGEDGLFTFQYLCYVDSIKYIPIPLWYILNRPESACNAGYTPRWKTAINAVDAMLIFAQNFPKVPQEPILALKAERAMWLETSLLRSDHYQRKEFLEYRNLLRIYGKYLIRREKRLKTVVQYFLYTLLPPAVLKRLLSLKRG